MRSRSKSKTTKLASMLLAATLLVGAAVPMEAHAAKTWDLVDIGKGTILSPGDFCITSGESICFLVEGKMWVDFGNPDSGEIHQNWTPNGNIPLLTYEEALRKDPVISIPEGTKFIEWKVVGIAGDPLCNCRDLPGVHKRVDGLNVVAVYESIDAPETGNSETAEEKAAREWKTSDNNPKNYLTELKASDGTVIVSGLPTKNNAADGAKIIVPMPLKEAETTFEKSKSEYQIVIKMDKSNCGEELKKLLQAEAQKQGATLSTVYDIKAEERAKKDYTWIRDITNVANEVSYMISLPADLTKAVGEGKTVSLLHYKEDGTVEVLRDTDLEKGTITVKTKKPSGIFGMMIH